VFPSDTNFLLVRTPAAAAVFQALLARGVLVKNVSQPGLLEGCLRITVGTALDDERLLRAMRAALGELPVGAAAGGAAAG
jgi:histidinol-phosphate/aromatic aminotransferase/cobyric acid decarboxylase-like protein